MGNFHVIPGFYFLALTAPVLATGAGLIIESYLHHSSISLLYLLAVLIVSVRTSTRPALFSALLSFLLYNFVFTEPRYTFVISHNEDLLTIGLFLLMAAVMGHQTARLRQQVFALQKRSEFARIQLDFLEQLAGDIDNHQVFIALHSALSKLPGVSSFLIETSSDGLSVTAGDPGSDPETIDHIKQFMAEDELPATDNTHYYKLQDGIGTVAVAGIRRDNSLAVAAAVLTENIETLVSQTTLVLGRTRLLHDLDKEKMEKERELLRSTLLTSISHDLRTPLSSMIGSASSLVELNESLSDQQKKELLETILQEANRLDSYIQNLLDMTRLGYHGLRLERDWIGLDEILSVVMRRIRPLSDKHPVKISIVPDIPLLYVHAALIEQAIYNVLENAIKYSPPDSPVRINTNLQDNFVVIDIIDDGPGIPASERDRIFDMFYTVNRKDQHSAGTGLGLAISKGMLGAHGGKIEVLENETSKGTLFRLAIPVDTADQPDSPEAT